MKSNLHILRIKDHVSNQEDIIGIFSLEKNLVQAKEIQTRFNELVNSNPSLQEVLDSGYDSKYFKAISLKKIEMQLIDVDFKKIVVDFTYNN